MLVMHAIKIRELDISDIPQIIECLNRIVSSSDSALFLPPSRQYIETIISGYGKTAGAFSGTSLVGFASIVFPKRGRNNLGYYIGLGFNLFSSVIQIEHYCVLKEYRGNGIARNILDYLLTNYSTQDSILLSTVSPKNICSLAIAFKERQMIVKLMNLYGGKRFVMCRMKNAPILDHSSIITIRSDEFFAIVDLISHGYIGVGFGDTYEVIQFVKGIVTNEAI